MKASKRSASNRIPRRVPSAAAAIFLLSALLVFAGSGGKLCNDAGKDAPAEVGAANAPSPLGELVSLQQEVSRAGLQAMGSLADAALSGWAESESGPAAEAALAGDGSASRSPQAAGKISVDPEEEQELADSAAETPSEASTLPPPTGVKVTQYGRDYLVEWSAVNHPLAAGYNVYRSFFANPRINVGRRLNPQPLRDTSFLDNAVRNRNRRQYYRVAAVTPGGQRGPVSVSVSIDPWLPDINPPSAVSAVDAAFLDDGLSVYWQAANREPDFTGYNLYLSDARGSLGIRLNSTPVKDSAYFAPGQTEVETPRYLAVRSVDTSGNESPYEQVIPVKAPPRIYDDLSPELTYAGFWKAERYEGPYGGSITVGNDAGAYMELSFKGRAVRLYTARYWTCGLADIYLDGRLVATVDLYSDAAKYSVPAYQANALKPGDHVIRMVLKGEASTNPHANPTGYHFGNVDFLVVH